jgi:hypothetical protein
MGSCSLCRWELEITPILHSDQPPCLIDILAKVLLLRMLWNGHDDIAVAVEMNLMLRLHNNR